MEIGLVRGILEVPHGYFQKRAYVFPIIPHKMFATQ